MKTDILKQFSFDLYQSQYEPWGITSNCAYKGKAVTTWDLDHNQGGFAELLDYYSEIFKFLCLVLFFITLTEYILIYITKLDKIGERTANKTIIARRLICIILGKIGFVVVSYMSANTENGKFNHISKESSGCTQNKVVLFELGQIA